MGANTSNNMEQGGAVWNIEGDLDIESGGEINVKSGADLDIESGATFKIAGTTVTPSAGDLNEVDGAPVNATLTVGAEAGNAIAVTIQLKDADSANIAAARAIDVWISDASTGNGLCATAPNGGIAASGTGVTSIVVTAGKLLQVKCGASGAATVTLTDNGTPTFYLAVRLPNGKVVVSGAITFA